MDATFGPMRPATFGRPGSLVQTARQAPATRALTAARRCRFLYSCRARCRPLLLLTGLTGPCARISRHVTGLDSSRKMIEINHRKQNTERVDFRPTDLFAWQPRRQYDLVAACFWLSHIPTEHLAPFLAKITASLRPDGLVFFVDSRLARTSRAKDHEAPEADLGTSRRKLADGREFEIVKIFHEPGQLVAQFANARLKATVKTTSNYFLYGTATRC